MPVFRIERTKNYTVMSNYHLRDSRISLSAKGLLSQMLSLPENWDYTLSGLRAINKEGKDAIRSSLRESEQAGYLRRSQTKAAPNGRFNKNEYVIYELPQKPEAKPEDEPSSMHKTRSAAITTQE